MHGMRMRAIFSFPKSKQKSTKYFFALSLSMAVYFLQKSSDSSLLNLFNHNHTKIYSKQSKV